jgi:predicted enzyme related to lactoylglutathione lyase
MAKKAAKKSAKKPAKKAAKKAAKQPEENVSRYAESRMNPVVHFELPMKKPGRMTRFYSEVFGWEAIEMGEEHGGYIVVHTGETSKDGMIDENGIINGGFFKRDKKSEALHPNIVIAVYDIEEHMKKVKKSGGKIIGQPEEIPGYGTTVSFYDTEGNRCVMIEPNQDWKDKTAE